MNKSDLGFNSKIINRLSVVLLAVALTGGVVLRLVRIGEVPLGIYCDEAINGYDAYSIALTGRDHHGNFLPLVMQGFNDSRMPLLDYSLVPLIEAFGLKIATVRLGTALWGIADMIAITVLAGLMLGLPGAAAAALLCGLSPWHLPLSRYGTEDILASTTVSLGMLWFFLWQKRRGIGWLLLSGMFFGLSLYAYGLSTVFTPFLLGLLAMWYWRDFRQSPSTAILGVLILLAFTVPQVFLILRRSAEMRAHFDELSLYRYVSVCPGCRLTDRTQAAASAPFLVRLGSDFVASWLGYLSPDFLFLAGDRGSHWELVFPLGFGMLLPEQAVFICLALIAAIAGRRRKLVVLLLGWVMLAALPAALLVPSGIWGIEPGGVPTQMSLINRPPPNVPLTPWLLFCHPQARHDVLAITPWILLSALGFVTLLELTSVSRAGQMAILAFLVAGATFHGTRFLRSYYFDYPIQAAPYFHYGLEQVMRTVQQLDDGEEPIIISPKIDQAYAYVLFYENYPPALLQRELLQGEGLIYHWSAYPLKLHPHAQPIRLGRYYFSLAPNFACRSFDRAIIVLLGNEPSPAPPLLSVHRPDGKTAYQVIRWDREHP